MTIIEFLLDQNTTLASIAQQSIVTVAAELAETLPNSEKYELHQALLDQEIFQGIVCGLIDIFSEKQQDNGEIIDSYNDDKQPEVTAVVEKTDDPETTTKLSSVIASTTNNILKNYDNGGINLAKMVCLMV